ncbi:MAG: ECF transporter S component [Oscillospiraceae bacterium]|nr:ECF transporter S component [Oscillospiraceae bacterium]
MNSKIKNIIILAILTALAYVAMLVVRVPFPAASFLTYDPKDVFIIIGGFLYGPLAVIPMSLVVSLLEMPLSGTGPVGLLMNILATCSFAFTAALIYKKRRTISGAVIGIISGVLLMIAVMILWNYLITPMYMGVPREFVAGMLIPVFLPFNLLKGIYNAAITILIYKRLSVVLRKLGILSESRIK